jgi:hypothetical protein
MHMSSTAKEATEAAEHASSNKKVALLIAILALCLSFSEIGGKQAENDAIAKNIEASNLWSFFQAKTIRRADALVAAEAMSATMVGVQDPAAKAAMEKQIAAWRANAVRLESEPESNEGRKELMARAKASEAARDLSKHRNEKFEIASGLIQIAIVLASASIITGIALLTFVAVGLGGVGLALMALGMFAPLALF